MTFQPVTLGHCLWRFMMRGLEMSTKNLIRSLTSYHDLYGYCLSLHWNCLAWLSVFLEALQNLAECSSQRCSYFPKWGISQLQGACWLFYLQKLHPGSVPQPNCKLFKQGISCFVLNISLTPVGLVKIVHAPLKTDGEHLKCFLSCQTLTFFCSIQWVWLVGLQVLAEGSQTLWPAGWVLHMTSVATLDDNFVSKKVIKICFKKTSPLNKVGKKLWFDSIGCSLVLKYFRK